MVRSGGISEQRTYNSREKTVTLFSSVTYFFISLTLLSENIESTSVLVYGKTPKTMQ